MNFFLPKNTQKFNFNQLIVKTHQLQNIAQFMYL